MHFNTAAMESQNSQIRFISNEQSLKICEEHLEIRCRTSTDCQLATSMILHSVQIKHSN